MSQTASLGPGREALKYLFPDGETDSDGETLQMELPELPQLACVAELAFNRGLSYSMLILFPFCTPEDKASLLEHLQNIGTDLKICNLTQCHPDPLLCFNPWASLRNPFAPPEKLKLCQGLPQSRAEFLNVDILSLSQR